MDDKQEQEQELEWFRKTQLGYICDELRNNLQSRTSKDEEVDGNNPIQKLKDTRLLQFETPSKDMKGFLVLEGCYVSEAEIFLAGKLLRLRNAIPSFKTTIQANNPYILSQLQNINNYVKEALDVISSKLYTAISANGKGELRTDLRMTDVLTVLEEIAQLLQAAKNQLLLPNSIAFPKNSSQPTFQPPLPQDGLLEFKIKNKMLVVNFAIMHPIPAIAGHGHAHSTSHLGSPSLSSSSNVLSSPEGRKTVKRQNQYFEVLEQSTVDCKVQKLDTIYSFVQQSCHLCSELQEKLSILGVM